MNDSWTKTIQIWRRNGKMKGSGDSWEVRTPQQCPSLEAVGKLPKEVYRHWCHLINDISFLVRNKTNVADRTIKALTKTGKLDVASNNSALDTSSVCWSPDTQERKDSQQTPREHRLGVGQDDDQEVQSQKWRERSSKKKLSTVPNAAYHR